MSIRERLLDISELNIEHRAIQMRDYQFDGYIQVLNSFVEKFPEKEAELKNALESKDYLAFSKCLAAIRDMLISICADELAEECLKQINGLVSLKHEKIEAYMTYLLSVLTILSIDIQMALFKGGDEEENEEEETLAIEIMDGPNPNKRSILAVDDNSFLLDALKKSLQDTEYKLTGVNSGKAALKFIQNHSPDLFLLDIEMPEMDGYELAQRIRDYGTEAPIIFITGNATKEYVLKAIKADAADFIVKPVTKKQVIARISRFI